MRRTLGWTTATTACCAPLGSPSLSDAQAEATARVFKALADPTPVQIVNLLATSPDEMCVCHINESFDLSQATLSHHLKKLVPGAFLSREQRGTWAFDSLNSDAFRASPMSSDHRRCLHEPDP